MLPLFLAAGVLLPAAAQDSADVQRLVERLYPKNERIKELRMGDIVRQLGIHPGSAVADVGCGPGQLSVVLAQVVGSTGRVYCEDIDADRQWGLGRARRDFRKRKLRNVAVVHGAADDPKLPAGALDAVLIVNAYHEMPQYQAMLRHIREALKPGGRLVILDNRPLRTAARPRDRQTRNHVLSSELAARELQQAGFRVLDREDAFIDDPDSESAHWLLAAGRE